MEPKLEERVNFLEKRMESLEQEVYFLRNGYGTAGSAMWETSLQKFPQHSKLRGGMEQQPPMQTEIPQRSQTQPVSQQPPMQTEMPQRSQTQPVSQQPQMQAGMPQQPQMQAGMPRQPQMQAGVAQQPQMKTGMSQQPQIQWGMSPQGQAQNMENTPYNNGTARENRLTFEHVFGKNVVGIVASLLIFLAFLMFGSYVYTQLGNIGKSLLLFAGSFCILGAGFVLHKKINNTFSLSVIGCGMGCIYISLIVSQFLFGFITPIWLYILFLGWLYAMTFLCRKMESTMLCVIGQIGLYVSLLFGIFYSWDNVWLWIALCGYSLIANLFYFRLCNLRGTKALEIYTDVCTQICLLVIAMNNNSVYWREFDMLKEHTVAKMLVIFVQLFIVGIFFVYMRKNARLACSNEKNSYYHIFALGNLLSISFVSSYITKFFQEELKQLFQWEGIDNFGTWLELSVFVLFLAGIVFYVESRKNQIEKQRSNVQEGAIKFDWPFYYVGVPLMLLMVCVALCILDIQYKGGFLLLAILLLCYGFIVRGMVYRVCGFVLLGVHAVGYEYLWLHILFLFIVFGVLFLLGRYKKYYHQGYKIVTYFIFLIYFFVCYAGIVENIYDAGFEWFTCQGQEDFFFLFVLIPLHIVALKTNFVKDWRDTSQQEKGIWYCVKVVSAGLLIWGTSILYDSLSVWMYVVMIGLTAALCTVGMKEMLKDNAKSAFVGAYVGMKLTAYIYAVLESSPLDYGFVISVVLILLALLCILTGFLWRVKSLRVYGLVLTMISVVKLVLIDIQYENTMRSVGALLVCGVLCFGINFLYNVLSKKFLE